MNSSWPIRPDGTSIPCPHAELWITAKTNATGHDLAASQLSNYNWTRYLLKTNGQYTRKVGVYAAVSATISFNTDLCWYLDTTFCTGFHAIKRSIGPAGALQLGRVVIFLIWTFILAELLFAIAHWLRAHAELFSLETVGVIEPWPDRPVAKQRQIERRDLKAICAYLMRCGRKHSSMPGIEAAQEGRRAAALLTDERAEEWFLRAEVAAGFRPCRAALRLVVLLFPVLFYAKIFLPCFDCYAFEATTAHEVGHLLGLHHPDQANGRNMMLDRTATWDCKDEWANVLVDTSIPTQPALMSAHSQTPGADCLTQDDLDGLNTLYPTCTGTVTRPSCHAQAEHVGWIRMFFFVGVPVTLLLLFAMGGHWAVTRGHERNREALRRKHGTGDVEARLLERRRFLMEARKGKRTGSVRALGRHIPTLLRREPGAGDGEGAGAEGAGAMVELAAATHNGGVCVGGGFGGAPTDVEGGGAAKKKSVLSDGDRLKAYSAALKTTSSSANLLPARSQVAPCSPAAPNGQLSAPLPYMQHPPRPTSLLAGVVDPSDSPAAGATHQFGAARLPPLGRGRPPPTLPSLGQVRQPPPPPH